jgi:hypothetical protein
MTMSPPLVMARAQHPPKPMVLGQNPRREWKENFYLTAS